MQMQTKSKSRLKVFLDNPSKALWSLAIPIMFGMGIQTLYNLVDMLFIGRLGGNAITGIAFNMPLFFLVLGLTMGLGTGVTAAIARFIGEENKKQADNCAEHAVFIALLISITLSSVGLLFGKDILSLFGASGEILNLGWEYLHVMCVGMPFMIFSGFFRSILAGEGDMNNPEKIMNGIPTHITCKYSQPKFNISPLAPNNDRISLPKSSPTEERVMLMIKAIKTACSAQLSACFLFSSPMNLAIAAVTPVPSPIVRPSTKKNKGILNAIPVIALPPSLPINNISTKL
jgi:hypothetical protein